MRSTKASITQTLENCGSFCFIELADGTRYKNYDMTDLSELDDIKIYFESESKNKSRIWVRDQNDDNHSFGFTGAPFAHLDISEAQSTDVSGNLVELKEGTFILERIVVPEATVNDDAPFDINFIVDKHDSSLLLDSSVEQLASAAFCKVHYVGDISDASIIIDGLDDTPNAVTKVKADAGHLVNITTDLPSSIHGVSVYFDDINDTGANRINTRVVNNTITIDLKDYFSREHNLNEEHSLIAQLKYEDEFGDPAWGEPEYRRFKIVDGAEPKITFGHEDDLGNTNGVYPNVIFARPYTDYPFTAEISFEDIVDPVNSNYSFRLINMTSEDGGSENTIYDITDVTDVTTPGAAEGEKVFEIAQILPFQYLSDVNVYKLEVLENGQALFQSRLFLLTDNPELIVVNEDSLRFDDNDDALYDVDFELKHVDPVTGDVIRDTFPRSTYLDFITYIDGDPSQEKLETYRKEFGFTNSETFSQNFTRIVENPPTDLNFVTGVEEKVAIDIIQTLAKPHWVTFALLTAYVSYERNKELIHQQFSNFADYVESKLKHEDDLEVTDSDLFVDFEIYKGDSQTPVIETRDHTLEHGDTYRTKFYGTQEGTYQIKGENLAIKYGGNNNNDEHVVFFKEVTFQEAVHGNEKETHMFKTGSGQGVEKEAFTKEYTFTGID